MTIILSNSLIRNIANLSSLQNNFLYVTCIMYEMHLVGGIAKMHSAVAIIKSAYNILIQYTRSFGPWNPYRRMKEDCSEVASLSLSPRLSSNLLCDMKTKK